MSLFLAVYEPASFQQNTSCLVVSCRFLRRHSRVRGRAIDERVLGGGLLLVFFSQTSHACQVRGSQRAATKSSSALGLRSDACSINSPSGERCGVVFIFESRRTSVWEKQCGWAMGYAGPKTEASHSRSSDKFPSSSSRSSSSSGL